LFPGRKWLVCVCVRAKGIAPMMDKSAVDFDSPFFGANSIFHEWL
jgi:hypothetical protein